jgi:hypothetical protein
MNINGIQTSQVSQNAFPAVNKDNAATGSRPVSSAGKISTGLSANAPGASQLHVMESGSSVNGLQKLFELLVVQFPPFFPIGKFQRLDLIKKIKGAQEEVEKSNIDPNLKKIYSGKKLSNDATDAEISDTLNDLAKLRDTLTDKKQNTPDTAKPGMILDKKV